MLEVINANYEDDYKIWLEFNNGSTGIADLRDDLWGTMFESLNDVNLFKKFKISAIMNTIEWENGADFAPEFLLDKAKKNDQTSDASNVVVV